MNDKNLIPTILNLFTLVGGHLYNRRYDRIVVFTTAFLLWYMVSWYLGSLILSSLAQETFGLSSINSVIWIYVAQFAGFLLLFIASAFTGFTDSTRAKQQLNTTGKWLTTAAGIGLSVYILYIVALQAFLMASADFNIPDKIAKGEEGERVISSSTSTRWYSTDDFFLNGTAFKRYERSFRDKTLPDPPTGNATITGEFHLDGKPVPGLAFDMVLDGQYRAKNIRTGANGRFTIPIRPGTWHIDYVHVTAWDNKPDGRDLTLLSGREGSLNGNQYHEHQYMNFEQGLPVQVSEDNQSPSPITFTIRDKVKLLQPNATTGKQKVTTDNYDIRWQSYPGAKRYLVKLSELTRKARSTSYHLAARKTVTGTTQLALADLKTMPNDGKPLEYQVQVFAFDDNNNYLSESPQLVDNATIILTDGKKIIDADADKMFSDAEPFNEKDYEQMRQNSKRLDAVKVLIQEKMYPEAKTLLDKVQGKTEPGAKDAITGYLLAEQNQCERASKYFDKAKQANPSSCVPDCYMKNCQ